MIESYLLDTCSFSFPVTDEYGEVGHSIVVSNVRCRYEARNVLVSDERNTGRTDSQIMSQGVLYIKSLKPNGVNEILPGTLVTLPARAAINGGKPQPIIRIVGENDFNERHYLLYI